MPFLLAAAVLSIDRLTKLLVIKNLKLHYSFPVIKGLLYFTRVHNRGAAFGLFKGQIFLFAIVSVVAAVFICLSLRKAKSNIYSLSLGLILAGAIGNLIDRLAFGYVIDFLDLRIWPVFNVADSAITVGAVLLGWTILNANKIESHQAAKPPRHQ